MAHTIDYWYNEIQAEKARQPLLAGITSTSKVSVFAMIAYVFAFVAWLLESLFGEHVLEVLGIIKARKPHRLEWYKTQALAFQYGQGYNKVLDQYDNAGLTPAQVAAQKLIAQASVNEVDTFNNVALRLLVVKEVAGDFVPLTTPELDAFSTYIEAVKDAGVKIGKFSLPADSLKLDMDIFYDPLILDGNGARIDGSTATPAQDAINSYLRDPLLLPFNGEYANTRLTDKLQSVEGIMLPVIKTAWAKYGLFPFTVIDERYVPNGGYIRLLPQDLTINWRPYVQ